MIKTFVFNELKLKGAYIIEPFVADDERGLFIKDYSKEIFEKNGIDHTLYETFYTISYKGTIRAIHFQEISHQPKLVRCISGRIFDVIVDLRPNSATFGKWLGFYLSGENKKEILVPPHFGHGYLVLEDSIVSYKCAAAFDGKYDSGIKYNDKDIGIDWPFDEIGGEKNIIISKKDLQLQSFKEYVLRKCP